MNVSELLAGAAAAPEDVELRLVLADALEEADEAIAAAFVRQELALRFIAPDHAARLEAEAELAWLRRRLPGAWKTAFTPPLFSGWTCACYEGSALQHCDRLHGEVQDTESDTWKRLCDAIDDLADKGGATFAPGRHVPDREWRTIVTLPPSIGRLTRVRNIQLHGSYLTRLPPEIGLMSSLEQLDTYTSYRLHWYPYELKRCRLLVRTTHSTRAVYANPKNRAPLPPLSPDPPPPAGVPTYVRRRACSVCGSEYEDRQLHRGWVTWRVGRDQLPLLVNACSAACLERA